MKTEQSFKELIAERQSLIEEALDRYLPPAENYPERLHAAMRYSVFAGGKRLRPLLTLLSCETCGGKMEDAMPPACAMELIHTYSLVHDDLPAMDDDDFRRGKPSSHRAFDEPTAILAGDALLTFAFELVASQTRDKSLVPSLVCELARGAGTDGMLGGQMVDILSQGAEPTEGLIRYLHSHKTGALIVASVRCGALCAHASESELQSLTHYAEAVGLGFQIIDDVLDVEGTADQLGKTPGKDLRQNKLTYTALCGVEKARRDAEGLVERAKSHLEDFGRNAEPLALLADFVVKRRS